MKLNEVFCNTFKANCPRRTFSRWIKLQQPELTKMGITPKTQKLPLYRQWQARPKGMPSDTQADNALQCKG